MIAEQLLILCYKYFMIFFFLNTYFKIDKIKKKYQVFTSVNLNNISYVYKVL